MNFTKSAKIAKIENFCKIRYRNINEVEGGPSRKLRILRNLRKVRKARNFAKIAIGILVRLKEGPERNCDFYEICENRLIN